MLKRRFVLQSIVLSCAAIAVVPGAQADADTNEVFRTAIIRDDFLQIRSMLQKGLDPNWRDSRGTPALVLSMQLESWRVAQELMRSPKIRINEKNTAGESALMLACIKGHLELVQQLIAQGAVINQLGWTPLHYAASADTEHSLATVKLLLAANAYVDAESPNQTTPLMLAAQYGSQATVDVLLGAGADVQLLNQSGLNAIDFAKLSGRQFMVDFLHQAHTATRKPKGGW